MTDRATTIELAEGQRLKLCQCRDRRPPGDQSPDRVTRAPIWLKNADGEMFYACLATTDFEEAVRIALGCTSVATAFEVLRATKVKGVPL